MIKINEPITSDNCNKQLDVNFDSKSDNLEINQEIIVGIDFGTTNSLISVIDSNKKILFFDDSYCNPNPSILHKSIVAFNKKGDIIAISNLAHHLNSQDFIKIHSIKRTFGKNLAEIREIYQQNLNNYHDFDIQNDENSNNLINFIINKQKYSNIDIAKAIFSHLKKSAEYHLKQDVCKAVITVPAYFDEAAKNITKIAANFAGFEVIRIINEPTAAALAFGIDNKSNGTYLIYDLGGGTFDVSVVKIINGVFKVIGVSGDNQLGGDDFDLILQQYLAKINSQITQSEAKKIKEEIISNGKAIYCQEIISLDVLNSLISQKIDRTIDITNNLIIDLGLEMIDITALLLVGGSTRIKQIKDKLAIKLNILNILDQFNPDNIVANGAAWQAYNLNKTINKSSQNLLLDVVSLSLGVEMMGGIVDKIIYRNTTLPISKSKKFTTFADNQTAIKFHIVQGERELAKDCRSLGHFIINKIPPMKAGMAKIEVIFNIDVDGLLTVTAIDEYSNNKQEMIVNSTFGLDEKLIKEILLESLENSNQDMQKRLFIETKTQIIKDITILKQDLSNSAIIIKDDLRKELHDNIAIIETIINDNNAEDLHKRDIILQYQEKINKIAENIIFQKLQSVLQDEIK